MTGAHKTYLGDGVYVALDEPAGAVVLTTENGIETTNTVVLEMETLGGFERWVAQRRAAARAAGGES